MELNYMKKYVVLAVVLLITNVFPVTNSKDSVLYDGIKLKKSTFFYTTAPIDSIHIPLYEKYPFTKNYLINQTILGEYRGAIIGTMIGAGIGFIDDQVSDYIYPIIPSTLLLGIVGVIIGAGTGTITGLIRGAVYNKKYKNYNDFHTRRMNIGCKYNLATFAPFTRINGYVRTNEFLGWHIIYRPLSYKPGVPDKIEIGFDLDKWGNSLLQDKPGVFLKMYKAEAKLRYDFKNYRLVTTYWAAGLGYQWWHEEGYRTFSDSTPVSYTKGIPCVRLYAGTELNLFDLVSVDAALAYEPIGAYLYSNNRKYLPYIQNFQLCFSFDIYAF